MTSEIFVVKPPVNAETSSLFCNPRNFSDTLDVKFLSALIRRGDENLDSNVRSDWWGLGTEDQSTLQRNVVREAPFCVLHPIIPVENDGEFELVSNSASALRARLKNGGEMHM
jgi:hypothetical protein